MAYQQTSTVYAQIKEKILNGEFKPAQNLTEQGLAQQFDASRVTIKKALLMLENDNLIESSKSKSARVRSLNIDEIIQFLRVRIVLEEYCARITAPIIPDDKVLEMEEILKDMHSLFRNGDLMSYSKRNVAFHSCIYDSCPNRVVVDFIWNLRNQISRYNFKTVLVSGRVDESYNEHLEILEAFRAHDPEKASAAIGKHVGNLLQVLEKHYKILFM